MGYVNAKAPKEVYHLTPKKNLPSILNEKVIKRFSDKECWFCESLPKLKKYMEYTVLQEGKLYYGVGGIPSHYPKFVPEEGTFQECHHIDNQWRKEDIRRYSRGCDRT